MSAYGIYYYFPSHSYANVKLLCLCSTFENAIKLIFNSFTQFSKNVNNSITCIMISANRICILWVNRYDMDHIISDTGLSCDQPQNSMPLLEYLVKE